MVACMVTCMVMSAYRKSDTEKIIRKREMVFVICLQNVRNSGALLAPAIYCVH